MVWALGRLCAPLVEFGSVTFFVRKLGTALPDGAAAKADVQIRWASASELDRLIEGRVDGPAAAELRERFGRGHRCVVAVDPDGRVVHTRWIARGRAYIPELDMAVMPDEGEAYFYDGYTWPEARGCSIDGAVRCFIFRSLHSAGLERVFSYVRGDNPPGVRAAERWQRPAGKLWYLRLRGFRPWVSRRDRFGTPVLAKDRDLVTDEQEKAARAKVWRRWFESWLREPLAKRSTGYHALPEAHFIATAEYISSTLRLDPDADSVLDVGCDSAMVSRFVAPCCRDFVGTDFIPGLLTDRSGDAVLSASGRPATFLAADGRNLPFRSGTFTKAYCSAVLHTLPSHADGLKIIRELVRVCRPGGEILVASLPDTRKRFRARLEAWRRAALKDKLKLACWFAIPEPIKVILRRRLLAGTPARLVFLEFDVGALKRELENHGLTCLVRDFPGDYWSRDFRLTRSNILLRIPPAVPGAFS